MPSGDLGRQPDAVGDALTELADAAFRQASVKVIRLAEQSGTSVIVFEDGEIRHLTPEEAWARLRQSAPAQEH
jgi:hypothetical protein